MPWKSGKSKLLMMRWLEDGKTGKTGPIGGICYQNATNFYQAEHRLDRGGLA
jgi:hypothetical protein